MNSDLDELDEFFAAEEEAAVVQVLPNEKELQLCLEKISTLRQEKDRLTQSLKQINKELDFETARAQATFDARGITKLGLDGVGTFYTTTKFYPAVHDRDRLVQFFDSIGEGALAPRTVHPSRLAAWWTEALTRGADLPAADVATAFEKKEIRLRKSPTKK